MPRKYRKFAELQEAWNSSSSALQVKEKLGYKSLAAIRAVAARARKAGYELREINDGFFPVETFINLWNSSRKLDVIAYLLIYSANTLKIYASNLKKKGFDLRNRSERVSDKELLRIWNSSENTSQVVYVTGYAKEYLLKRIHKIRQKENVFIKSLTDRLQAAKNEEAINKKKSFILIWNESSSVKEVANKTGLSPKSVSSIATRRRKEGYDLRYYFDPNPRQLSLPFKNSLQLSLDF